MSEVLGITFPRPRASQINLERLVGKVTPHAILCQREDCFLLTPMSKSDTRSLLDLYPLPPVTKASDPLPV